jgi:hypothetical protein
VELAEVGGLGIPGCFGSKMPASGIDLPMTSAGIALVSFSPIAKGWPMTRAASLTACLALIVP